MAGVFDSVASKYDVMNDVMSAGLHRLWKAFAVREANVRAGMKVLDIAGGTADLASAFAERAGATGEVWLTDINASMLAEGRDRLLDRGQMIPMAQCDAERLPFASGYFDLLSVAFGLRNMTHKDAALAEMQRVLKPGGRLLVLEFSRVWQPIAPIYDAYSLNVCRGWAKRLLRMPKVTAISPNRVRMHPPQDELPK